MYIRHAHSHSHIPYGRFCLSTVNFEHALFCNDRCLEMPYGLLWQCNNWYKKPFSIFISYRNKVSTTIFFNIHCTEIIIDKSQMDECEIDYRQDVGILFHRAWMKALSYTYQSTLIAAILFHNHHLFSTMFSQALEFDIFSESIDEVKYQRWWMYVETVSWLYCCLAVKSIGILSTNLISKPTSRKTDLITLGTIYTSFLSHMTTIYIFIGALLLQLLWFPSNVTFSSLSFPLFHSVLLWYPSSQRVTFLFLQQSVAYVLSAHYSFLLFRVLHLCYSINEHVH